MLRAPLTARPPARPAPAAPRTRARADPPSRPTPPDDDEALLLADLERYGGGGAPSSTGRPAGQPPPPSPKDEPAPSSLKDALDRLLVADFFFVLLALAWLVAGVAVRAGGGSPALADAWLALWTPLFQPAIGLLMAGALVSGGLGWWRDKQEER